MTGKRQYSRLEKTAYHEAGHAPPLRAHTDQTSFVRPDNSRMEHRRPAECGLYLTCKVNQRITITEPEPFSANHPVI
jgi:hypothetical protein